MPEIQITATSDALSINGYTWHVAPLIEEICQAIGDDHLVDGDFVTVQGVHVSKFRYFEDLGISVLESIPEKKLERISVHMQTPTSKRPARSPYFKCGTTGQRPTASVFSGRLELNEKQVKSPLRFSQFPLKGELLFVHRIAIGNKVCAHVAVKLGFVECVTFDFRKWPHTPPPTIPRCLQSYDDCQEV